MTADAGSLNLDPPPAPPTSEPVLGARQLAVSAEPIVVFTSLAELIVGSFADHCQIDMIDTEGGEHRISSSAAPASVGPVAAAQLSLPVLAEDGEWSATVVLSWYAPNRPTAEDVTIARLLLDAAAGLLERQRLRTLLRRQTERADNLVGALETNRAIGKAIGILMATHQVTDEQAFSLMRDLSQQSHRKVREIAVRVARTGTLLDPDE